MTDQQHFPTQLLPTMITVDEEILRRSLTIAEDSKEFAQVLLAIHERDLGRTTVKNRLWAEYLDQRIAAAGKHIDELRGLLFPGCTQ